MQLDEILRHAVALKASDVHITSGVPPVFRINGQLVLMSEAVYAPAVPPEGLTADQIEDMARKALTEKQWNRFTEEGEVDLSLSLSGLGRFRVNVFRQRGSASMAVRVISHHIFSMEELKLPPVLKTLVEKPNGLILVTGPTGSGKSTTLAAMIDYINTNRSCHIITLEDPIEYLHRHKKSIVKQREIGSDTLSFASALRAAMRQDPDVILVGEMRDLETISITITAAETGHLVFASLHTCDTARTIDRIIDVFPAHQQPQIQFQLSGVLQGIIAQQLMPRVDGEGRVAAFEIMVATPAIRNLIREGKTHQIISTIQSAGKIGMQTMDSSLLKLYQLGMVSREEVLAKAVDPDGFQQRMTINN